MNKDEKELQNLFEEAAAPKASFVDSLRIKMSEEFNNNSPRNKFSNIFTMFYSQLKVKNIALASVAVFAIGTVSIYSYFYLNSPARIANQDEILAHIASLNPNQTSNKPTAFSSVEKADEKISASMIRYEGDRKYNYKKTTNSYNIGPAAKSCAIALPYQGNIDNEENIQYFKTKEEWYPTYTKYTTLTSGKVYEYYLTKNDEQWEYKGGEYAVHIKGMQSIRPLAAMAKLESSTDSKSDAVVTDSPVVNPTEVTNPSPNVVVTSEEKPIVTVEVPPTVVVTEKPTEPNKDAITNRFGEGAKIIGTTTANNAKVYKIQWTQDIGCKEIREGDSVSIGNYDKAIIISLADAKTFEIVSETYYLNSVSNKNRLYTRETKEITKTVKSTGEIASEFEFTYPVSVKDFDLSKYDYQEDQQKVTIEYIKNNKIDVTYLNSKGYVLQSFYAPKVVVTPKHQAHLVDRAFYSNDSYGQEQYNSAKDMFKPYFVQGQIHPVLQLSYSNEKNTSLSWVNVNNYNRVYTDEELLKTAFGDSVATKKSGTISIKVGAETVSANVYETVQNAQESSASGGIDKSYEPEYKEYFVTLNNANRSIAMQFSAKSGLKLSDIAKLLIINTVSSETDTLNTVLKVAKNSNNPIIAY